MDKDNSNFTFSYSAPTQKEREEIDRIRRQYIKKEETPLESLRRLDREIKRPAEIFAYIFGSLGALTLGGGMSLTMPEIASGYMLLGICIGVVGIAMLSFNYFIYKKILEVSKKKHKDEVLRLANLALSE